MRIFQGFLVLVVVAILWMLPVSQAIYDFRTEPRDDVFAVTTGVSENITSVVLLKSVYDEDTGTISLLSDLATDTPDFDSYTPATHVVDISGLTADSSRELTVTYDIDALSAHAAVSVIMDLLPTIWILILVAFPVVSLIVIFRRRV